MKPLPLTGYKRSQEDVFCSKNDVYTFAMNDTKNSNDGEKTNPLSKS